MKYGVSLHGCFCYIFLLEDCHISKVITSPVSSHCHGCCKLSTLLYQCCCYYILSFVDWHVTFPVSLHFNGCYFHLSVSVSVDCCIVKLVWQCIHKKEDHISSSNDTYGHHCTEVGTIQNSFWLQLIVDPIIHQVLWNKVCPVGPQLVWIWPIGFDNSDGSAMLIN